MALCSRLGSVWTNVRTYLHVPGRATKRSRGRSFPLLETTRVTLRVYGRKPTPSARERLPARFGLPLAHLPGEEFAKRPAGVPQPFPEIVRQGEHQFEACLRLLLAHRLERVALEYGQLHVGGRTGGEQVLTFREQREVPQRIAGLHFTERLPALAHLELQRPAPDEVQRGGGLSSSEHVRAAAHGALLARIGEDAHADVAEVAQQRRSAQRGEAIHQAPRPCMPASLT